MAERLNMIFGVRLSIVAVSVSGAMLLALSPQPTPTPTVYRPTGLEASNRTLSSGVYGAPAGNNPAGQAVDGFALSLTANRYTLRMGDGLTFAAELRNVSGSRATSRFSASDVSYSFIVGNTKAGSTATRRVLPKFGPPADYQFAPGTALYLWFLPQLTDTMQEPGKYTVQALLTVGRSTIRSNVVTLEILPARDGTPEFAQSDPSRQSPSGPPQSGVALAVSMPAQNSVYRIGLPMWLIGELRNATSDLIAVRGINWRSYAIEVVDAGSKHVLRYQGTYSDAGAFTGGFGTFGIPKGQSHFFGVRIDRLFSLAPGHYLVRASATMGVQPIRPAVWISPSPVTLQSNTVKIDVLPAWSPAKSLPGSSVVYEGAPGEGPTGSGYAGFALSLAADWTKTDLGAPLFATVELRNISGAARDASFGQLRGYDFRIVNEQTGAIVPRDPHETFPNEASQQPWARRRIYPDTSLYSSFGLTKLYHFTEGGTYSVRVIGRPTIAGKQVTLQSNPLEVTLVAQPPRVSLPLKKRVLSYAIKTDRLVYTTAQPIRVQLTLTNLTTTPIAYSLNRPQPPCILIIADSRGSSLVSTRDGRGKGPGIFVMVMPRLPVGETTFAWTSVANWGYQLDRPGEYTISAKPDIGGDIFTPTAIYPISNENASDAEPTTIRILSNEAARMEGPLDLNDPSMDALFRRLLAEYRHMHSSLSNYVDQLQRKAANPQLSSDSEAWSAAQKQLERDVSVSDPRSPYRLVGENLRSAALELGLAGQCALRWRDGAGAANALKIADYYYNAVQNELATNEAKVTDAGYPPNGSMIRGYCDR